MKRTRQRGLVSRLWVLLSTKEIQPTYIDAWLIAGLLVANPLVWGWTFPPNLTPDAIGYLTFAETAITNGSLYLAAWGHVDLGAIFPPLYPALIALANVIRPDAIANALFLSALFMVLTTLVLYVYIKRLVGRPAAVIGALAIQVNWHYVFFGSRILTEPLFLFLTACALLLLQQRTLSRRPRWTLPFALGAIAGLTFLSRQIGLSLLSFLVVWLAAEYFYRRQQRTQILRDGGWLLLGWMIIVAPYVVALYLQTGASPLEQTFRMNQYAVYSDGTLAQREATDETRQDYVAVYRQRRALRQLLPDASEMLGYVLVKNNQSAKIEKTGILAQLDYRLFLDNLGNNVAQSGKTLGVLFLLLFTAATISAATVKHKKIPRPARLILPGFVLCYVLTVSALSGAIARYLAVLFPFLFAVLAVEGALLVHKWQQRGRTYRHASWALAGIIGVVALTSTRTLLDAQAPPPSMTLKKQNAIADGQPVFSLLPVHSYLAGGSYRILPNDSLDKTVHYAQRTSVRWLLVPERPADVYEIHFYANASWLHQPQTLASGHLRFCCKVNVPDPHLLYEILQSDDTALRRRSER